GPDVLLAEGDELSEYGLDARVLHFPGHSAGSIGILTADGDLFCGDLLINSGEPQRNTIVDEPTDMDASYNRLAALNIQTVYPGHGEPFAFEALQRAGHDS
ncbi:MAG: MBL fold metallo-hydrolase, partial [Coriobacteriia bacterium]|nr:MBL fold metallo-hydrolase [Coriobacteriia bacterium]